MAVVQLLPVFVPFRAKKNINNILILYQLQTKVAPMKD